MLEPNNISKLESEIQQSKCINSDNSINYKEAFYHIASPKFFSNITIYATIFAYLTNARYLFYILFPLLVCNAVMGTYMIIFNWKNVGNSLIKRICRIKGFIEPVEFDNLYQKYQSKISLIRFICILYHWLPVIILYFTNILDYQSQEHFPTIMGCWLLSMIIGCFYLVLAPQKQYGNLDPTTYIITYPIILLIIIHHLYAQKAF